MTAKIGDGDIRLRRLSRQAVSPIFEQVPRESATVTVLGFSQGGAQPTDGSRAGVRRPTAFSFGEPSRERLGPERGPTFFRDVKLVDHLWNPRTVAERDDCRYEQLLRKKKESTIVWRLSKRRAPHGPRDADAPREPSAVRTTASAGAGSGEPPFAFLRWTRSAAMRLPSIAIP